MLTMLRNSNHSNGKNFPRISALLFQASASLFSYQPILSRLQKMVSIPFSEQLAFKSVPVLVDENAFVDMEKLKAIFGSDLSQIEAMRVAVTNNVSIIQGPPGTGKSFVGMNVAKYLLESDDEARILCICYTNHALDDFLESLIDSGISKEKIIRLGNSPKVSERLKSRCLSEINDIAFDRSQSARYGMLKGRQEELLITIEGKKRFIEVKEWGSKWFRYNNTFSYQSITILNHG